jgi:hypothetical protein
MSMNLCEFQVVCAVDYKAVGTDIRICRQDVLCLSMNAGYAATRQKQYVRAFVVWTPENVHKARTGLRAGHRRW